MVTSLLTGVEVFRTFVDLCECNSLDPVGSLHGTQSRKPRLESMTLENQVLLNDQKCPYAVVAAHVLLIILHAGLLSLPGMLSIGPRYGCFPSPMSFLLLVYLAELNLCSFPHD